MDYSRIEVDLLYKKKISMNFYEMVSRDSANCLDHGISLRNRVEIYKMALERYQNDEYAPFVAIDLGNIYKEQALYTEAIKIYEKALTLSAVNRNASTKKEFANNLQYLRVVHDVLLKYHVLSTPFSQLSREILQEIDTEFKKVQINSAQSK